MLLDFSNLNEETLKIQIKAEFFKDKKFLYSGDKIDFILSYKHHNAILPILWGKLKGVILMIWIKLSRNFF
ncbi:hypothetical protein JP0145_14670 [Helicobacter pylori]